MEKWLTRCMESAMAHPRTLPLDGAESLVSLRAEVPEPLLEAMRQFIEHHPNWDQYRLF